MAIIWERAAHSVDHMFSLYFDFVILVISSFGFKGGIWVLIAPVPGHCILVTHIARLVPPSAIHHLSSRVT